MLRIIATGTMGLALACGAAVASAETITAPRPPNDKYVLPEVIVSPANNGLYEGRSMYRMEDPSTFPGKSDEMGYPSGNPENPHTPN
jgi:hypothetical protein